MKKILKWLLMGVLPMFLFIVIYVITIRKAYTFEKDVIKASIILSFIPYFGLPHFYKKHVILKILDLREEGMKRQEIIDIFIKKVA